MSENSKLIMIHLYNLYSQTLTDSYDPSGRQLITPHTHTYTPHKHQYFKKHTLALSHTHTFIPLQCQCVYEMSVMLHVKDLYTEGINKHWH